MGGTLLPPLVYWIHADDPAFDAVSVASGVVALRIYNARPHPQIPTEPGHIVLVRLVTDQQLLIEAFPGDAQPAAFTANALVYRR